MVERASDSIRDILTENQSEAGGQRQTREELISSGRPIIRSSLPGPPRQPLADIGQSHIFHVEALLDRKTTSQPSLLPEIEEWLQENKVEFTLDLRPRWAAHASTITIVNPKDAIWFKLTWM